MDNVEGFYEALDAAIERAGNMNKLARFSGVSIQSLSRWRSRDRTPSLDQIAKILPFIDWPSKGSQKIKYIEGNVPEEEIHGKNLYYIDVVSRAGAGNPTDWEESENQVGVPFEYYTNDTKAVLVKGDSMEPTIKDGSIAGVIPVDGPLKEGAIYLVRIPAFGLVIKRVKANGMHGITLISDNPNYAPINVDIGEYEEVIVAKVTWILQKV